MGKEKVSKWREGIMVSCTVIIVICTLSIAICTWNSLSLEKSSHVPNEPELEIYPSENYFRESIPTLSVQQVLGETTAGEGQKVRLYIRNTGGMDTYGMTFDVVSPPYLKSRGGIVNYPKNVKSHGVASVVIYIKSNEREYNNSLQLGDIVPVIFKITCANCESQKRNFNETFNFSITV